MSGVFDSPDGRPEHGGLRDFAPNLFRERALTRLRSAPPPGDLDPKLPPDAGDHDLNAGKPRLRIYEGAPRRAAVLVPVVARPAGATVLLTRRTEHLSSHAGQVAFPGGKVEASDTGPRATALRETCEEIGLGSEVIDTVGYLDLYETGTGFRVVPVVGVVDPEYHLVIDENEVASVFEVPLSFLMDTANHKRESRLYRGIERHFYAMPYADNYIWGATAGIIRNLYNRVYR